jgi:GNAT superfamily N-acetyltransferase
MIIRQAIRTDAPAVAVLLTQLGYPPPQENLDFVVDKIETYSAESYRLLVCEVDGDVAGFISLHWFQIFHSPGLIGRITAFCVHENVRSKGIGQFMLMEAEKFLRTEGCTSVEVTSNLRRLLTHSFYLKNGYAETSKRFIKSLITK